MLINRELSEPPVIDFTTTATCRPEILRRTLESFKKNLLGVDLSRCRMHCNIDPVPDPKLAFDVERVVMQYFVAARFHHTAEPCFPAAVKWCWSQPETPVFFHLEDDWELTRPVHMRELFRVLAGDGSPPPGLELPMPSCVNLRAYDFPDGDKRICLSPGLFRSDHARAMASRMVITANPEKQLRPRGADNLHGDKHGEYIGVQFPRERVLRDIGRAWLTTSGFRKSVPVFFTKWEPVR